MDTPIALMPQRLMPVPCPPRFLGTMASGTTTQDSAPRTVVVNGVSLVRYLTGTLLLSSGVIAPVVILAVVVAGVWLSDDRAAILAAVHYMTSPVEAGVAANYQYPLYGLALVWMLTSLCAAGALLIGDPWLPPTCPAPATARHGSAHEAYEAFGVTYVDHDAVKDVAPGLASPCWSTAPRPGLNTDTGVLMPATIEHGSLEETGLAESMAAEWATYCEQHGELSLSCWLLRIDEHRCFPAMVTSNTTDAVRLIILQSRVPFTVSRAEFDGSNAGPFLLNASLRDTDPATYNKHRDWLRNAFRSLGLSVGIASD